MKYNMSDVQGWAARGSTETNQHASTLSDAYTVSNQSWMWENEHGYTLTVQQISGH